MWALSESTHPLSFDLKRIIYYKIIEGGSVSVGSSCSVT